MSGVRLLHPTFIRRQLNSTRSQTVIFLLCVMLSIVTLVALRGFGDSVDDALTRDARALIAGDVVVRSNYPFATELDDAIAAAVESGAAQAVRTYEFYSIVRRTDEDASVLSNLKVVEEGWPFYGAGRADVGPPSERGAAAWAGDCRILRCWNGWASRWARHCAWAKPR